MPPRQARAGEAGDFDSGNTSQNGEPLPTDSRRVERWNPRTTSARPPPRPATRAAPVAGFRQAASAAKKEAAKRLPASGSAAIIILQRQANACFCEAKPTPNDTRRAGGSQGGAPVKSLGGVDVVGSQDFRRPKFLRGGCLDGSAAAATATKERLTVAGAVNEGGTTERTVRSSHGVGAAGTG